VFCPALIEGDLLQFCFGFIANTEVSIVAIPTCDSIDFDIISLLDSRIFERILLCGHLGSMRAVSSGVLEEL